MNIAQWLKRNDLRRTHISGVWRKNFRNGDWIEIHCKDKKIGKMNVGYIKSFIEKGKILIKSNTNKIAIIGYWRNILSFGWRPKNFDMKVEYEKNILSLQEQYITAFRKKDEEAKKGTSTMIADLVMMNPETLTKGKIRIGNGYAKEMTKCYNQGVIDHIIMPAEVKENG